MRRLALALAVLLLPAGADAEEQAVGPATCPAERAIYELRAPDTQEVWRLAFVPARHMASIASDLYLKLTTPQRDYWFTFSVSQGYSGISVFPVTDPYAQGGPRDLLGSPYGDNAEAEHTAEIAGSLRFLSFDPDLNVAFVPPMAGEDAPQFIMMPDIGLTLWYEASALTDDARADRDPMPRGIFRLAHCLDAPHPLAGPGKVGLEFPDGDGDDEAAGP